MRYTERDRRTAKGRATLGQDLEDAIEFRRDLGEKMYDIRAIQVMLTENTSEAAHLEVFLVPTPLSQEAHDNLRIELARRTLYPACHSFQCSQAHLPIRVA